MEASSSSQEMAAALASRAVRPIANSVAYFATFTALGLVSASLGPTLPGLAENTGSLLADVSYLFTTRACGYMIGSLTGGQLYDRVPGHPIMAAAALAIVAMTALVPVLGVLVILAGTLLILGIAEGILDVGGNTLIVWTHGAKVGPYMNALHFFFGVGAFLSPILIAQAVKWSGDITWAYWLLALLVTPVIWLVARLPSPKGHHNQSHVGQTTDTATTKTTIHRNTKLALLAAFFMFLYVGAEVSFGGWIFAYTVGLGLADEEIARYMTSAFWGALTIGRLVSIPLTARLRPRTILLADMIGCLASVGIILLWTNSITILWIGTLAMGFFQATIFPLVILWAERRMTLTGQVTSWFFVGASLGSMSVPWLIGQFFERTGPVVTMTTIAITLVVATVVFIILMALGGKPLAEKAEPAAG